MYLYINQEKDLLTPIILASVVLSLPHLLQVVPLAKFMLPRFLSGQIQSLSLTRKLFPDNSVSFGSTVALVKIDLSTKTQFP